MRGKISAHLPHRTVVYAHARAALSRHRLPPGKLLDVIADNPCDQTFLRRRTDALGPMFSATALNEYCVCINDLALARRLLATHSDDLEVLTIDITSLVPAGFMRQMVGDTHRTYRKALARAVFSHDPERQRPALEQIVAATLATYARESPTHGHDPAVLWRALRTAASGMLIQLFLGAKAGSEPFGRLIQGFDALGPKRIEWRIGQAQHEAFAAIQQELLSLREHGPDTGESDKPMSIMHRLHVAGVLDDTLLGNLIYMVEMGRQDMAAFFRWLARHGGAHADAFTTLAVEARAHIAVDQNGGAVRARPIANGFVLETLRQNQSERLMRRARRDFVFNEFLIPRGAVIRIGMWEAHHDPKAFDQPDSFLPDRFTITEPKAESFSPFGLDQHLCPFSAYSVQLGEIFVSTLAKHWVPTLINDGPPVIGMHHWQPPRDFSIALTPR